MSEQDAARDAIRSLLKGLDPKARKATACLLLLAAGQALAEAEADALSVTVTVLTRDRLLQLSAKTHLPAT